MSVMVSHCKHFWSVSVVAKQNTVCGETNLMDIFGVYGNVLDALGRMPGERGCLSLLKLRAFAK